MGNTVEEVRREIRWISSVLTDSIIKASARYTELKERLRKIDKNRQGDLYALYEHDLALVEDYIMRASVIKSLLEALDTAITNGRDVRGLLDILYEERRAIPEFLWSIEWIVDTLRGA